MKKEAHKPNSVNWQRFRCRVLSFLPDRAGISYLYRVILTCAFTMAASTSQAYLSAYKADGYITIIPYDSDGKAAQDQIIRRNFTISVKGQQWLLKSEDANNTYHFCGCDGTNIYYLFFDSKAHALSVPATISNGLYPLNPGTTLVTLPWLAFASATYLNSLSNNPPMMPAPWVMPLVDPAAYIYSFTMTQFDDGVPEKISFRVLQSLLNSAPHNKNLDVGNINQSYIENRTQALAWYKDGFVGGDYVVTQVTNWMGMTLPMVAELKRYAPERNGGLFEIHRITVTNLSLPNVPSYVPILGSLTSVVDQRFRDPKAGIDYIQYQISDDKWPTKENAQLLKLKLAKEKELLWQHASSTQTIVRLILLTTTILPLGFLCWKYWKDRVRITNKQ